MTHAIDHPAIRQCETFGTAAADVRYSARDATTRTPEDAFNACADIMLGDGQKVLEFYDSVERFDREITKHADDFLANRITAPCFDGRRAESIYNFRQLVAKEMERYGAAKRKTGHAGE